TGGVLARLAPVAVPTAARHAKRDQHERRHDPDRDEPPELALLWLVELLVRLRVRRRRRLRLLARRLARPLRGGLLLRGLRLRLGPRAGRQRRRAVELLRHPVVDEPLP